MANKQKVFCKISDYLQAKHPELLDIINNTCSLGALDSGRGKLGITFLLPTDKDSISEFNKLVYSSDPDDFTKCSELIKAHIIKDCLKTTSDWNAHKDDLPDSRSISQKVAIDKTTTTEVHFPGGAKAVIDSDFIDGSSKRTLAVWKLTGKLKPATDMPSANKYYKLTKTARPGAKTGKGQFRGAYDAGKLADASLRQKIALEVENAYRFSRLKLAAMPSSSSEYNPYTYNTLSLINYIINVDKNMQILHDFVIPTYTCSEADFYILIEPHTQNGHYLLPTNLIESWWRDKHNHKFSPREVCDKVCAELSKSVSTCLVHSDRKSACKAISEVRAKIMSTLAGKPREICKEIRSAYNEMCQRNAIPGCSGKLWPQALADYYTAEPGLKQIHDEIQFILYFKLRELESATFDSVKYQELLNLVGEMQYRTSESDRASTLKICNNALVEHTIAPAEVLDSVKTFINSTCFLSIPMTRDEARECESKYTTSRPKPGEMILTNIFEGNYVRHERLLMESSPHKDDILAALKSLDPNSLDDELREALKAKFS